MIYSEPIQLTHTLTERNSNNTSYVTEKVSTQHDVPASQYCRDAIRT